MLGDLRQRAGVARPLAFLAALAITAAWSLPHASAAGSGRVDAAAAAPRVAAALSGRATPRDDAFDGFAAAKADRTSSSLDSRGSSTAAVTPAVAKGKDARAEAAAKTPKPSKKGDDSKSKSSTSNGGSGGARGSKGGSNQSFKGTNRFWIPSLGMSYGVRWYGCSASYYPKNVIYRWGCAGTNNVYLFGHAYGVMKPLHDLYVRGGLTKGMVAVFANADGKVTKYRVTEWRVVRPTQVAWQIASQPRPSMTLQTCVGAKSQYRLNVRLVAVD